MINQSNIERIVMRRVRLIRLLALVVSTATLAALTTVASLWGIGREVWVARVFQNMPPSTDLDALVSFWFVAFTRTHLIVQILAVLTLMSLLFLSRELIRAISELITPSSLAEPTKTAQ